MAIKYSPEMLVAKANEFLSRCQLDMGATFLQRALEAVPDNTGIMDQLAAVLLETGNVQDAQSLLLRSIELAPNSGHEKYLYMGQLQKGILAVTNFRRGIDILKQSELQCQTRGDLVTGSQIASELASAYCSIVEVYMSDLCFECNAEEECNIAIAAALQAKPDSIMALQTLANLRLCQNNRKDAVAAMKLVVKHLSQCTNDDDTPSYQLRSVIVKLLVELNQSQVALDLVTSLLEEDDSNAEVWYLAGLASRDLATCLLDKLEKGKKNRKNQVNISNNNDQNMTIKEQVLYEVETLLDNSLHYLNQSNFVLKKVQIQKLENATVGIQNGIGDVSSQIQAVTEAIRIVGLVTTRMKNISAAVKPSAMIQ